MEKLSRFTLLILVILGVLIELAIWRLAGISDVTSGLASFYWSFGTAFFLYLVALAYLARFWHRTFFSPETIIVFGVLFRVTMLFADPVFSDDVYRHVWDGRVANAGINPYVYAPDSPNLFGLRDDKIFPHVNHPEIPTIYPPVLQLLSGLTTFIWESVTAVKIVWTLFDIGLMFVLLAMLRTLDRPRGWIMVYAWNPLVVLEIAGSGHADIVGVFFLVLGLLMAIKDKPLHATAILTVSTGSKFIALPTLPFIEDLRSRAKEWVLMTAVFVAGAALLYLPYIGAGTNLWSALATYVADWEFNGFFYHHLLGVFKDFWPVTDHKVVRFGLEINDMARFATKITLTSAGFLVFVGLLIVHLRKPYGHQKRDLIGFSFVITATVLLLSPTLHPWYLVWIVPYLCIHPNPAWILMSGLISLAYTILPEYHRSGSWTEDSTILFWQFIPFLGILISLWAYKTIKKIRSHPEEQA